ncbi:MAG: DUF3426 domain-containing protein [Bryobacterales bacterium]|nr:DUF3426 domain-containing protein [Bryobacterales bacterium]
MANDFLVTSPVRPAPASKVPLLIVGVVALAAAGAYLYMHQRASEAPPGMVLTGEAKAYVKHLGLSDVGMRAHESYMGGTVVEITGKITNNGDRALKQVDLYCVFYDTMGQVVLREPVPIVRGKTGGLSPAATKDFRLPFDNLPASWNQGMPQLVIGQIVF